MKFERIETDIFQDSAEGSLSVARVIADLIRKKQKEGKQCVLGLSTGSSPLAVYGELVKMHKYERLSFHNVITFNLDEYYPMNPVSLQSYVRFMNEYLFDYVDVKKGNINIPSGELAFNQIISFCEEYEKKIDDLGGIDLQILGIGKTGHIGFNEPGSDVNSQTRLITLDQMTRVDVASDFFGKENVPRRGITMGVSTILKAKKILLLAWGEAKAKIIKKTVESDISGLIPATYLQDHKNTTVVLDEAAASELTRQKTPWLVGQCNWTKSLTKKAVVWLSEKTQKPILKLTEKDYNDNSMGDLVSEQKSAYSINIQVFNSLQRTITGWPGGKPNADDIYRPERAKPVTKKVVIFSPHPDDDVISMGGTFIRLVDQGHDVHVAYQTSGNIAVSDEDVIRFADFLKDYNQIQGYDDKGGKLYEEVIFDLKNKKFDEVDSRLVRTIKGLIRRGEAKAACRSVGIAENKVNFLNMPFYETGLIKKKPLIEEDIAIIEKLLQDIRPHQVYAAGDLSDPHGTHRVCLKAVLEAIDNIVRKEKWINNCWVWLYRGAWQEWGVCDIDMAVPISPEELLRKRKAIFKHQSQKDTALFPGSDTREFWVRAEDRNRATAEKYDMLGLAEYEAIEAFKRYKF